MSDKPDDTTSGAAENGEKPDDKPVSVTVPAANFTVKPRLETDKTEGGEDPGPGPEE